MIEFFLRKNVLVNLVTVFVVATGLFMLTKINRATYPNVDFDIMMISTTYPGASAYDVEVNVTKKLEDELDTVRDIDKIRSLSLENLSIIYVWVDLNANDPAEVKDEIRRAVDRVADLPKEIDEKPKIDELKSSNVSVIELALSGAVKERILRKIAKDLEERINEIPGVGMVELVGYRKREVKVLVDTNHLEKNYVSLNEIAQAIANRNVRTAGGTLESFTSEKKIVTFSEFDQPTDVGDVIVRQSFDGGQVKLSEVATIQQDYEDHQIYSRTGGKQSINLLIRAQSHSDIINISNSIKDMIAKITPTLPQGVELEVVADFSRYTKSLLGLVVKNAIFGFFLVLICLFLFLNPITSLWTAVGIPVSFLGALLFFPLFNIDINFISLITLVLVLGMLVDDAIVVAENISSYREQGKPVLEAALLGVKEVCWPVTATILTTIVAFMSLTFMTGVSGKFVREIPIVVTLCLVISLLESIFILPSHIANSPQKDAKRQPWIDRLTHWYERFIRKMIVHRWMTLFGFVCFIIVAASLFWNVMKINLFPYNDVDLFFVVAELPEGSSLEETAQKMKEVEGLVSKISSDSMMNYTTRVGHHDRDVYGVTAGLRHNWAMVSVFLKPAQERPQTSEEIMQDLRAQLNQLKGFSKLELDKFNDGPPVGRPITITVVSDDDSERRQILNELFEYLKKIPGTQSLEVDDKLGKEELLLKPNYDMMARLGITSMDLANTIRAAFNGVVVTQIVREGEEIDFRVQLKINQRRRVETLKKLQVLNREGRLIPIEAFTTLEPSQSYEAIHHYNGRRASTVFGDVDGKTLTSSEVNQMVRDEFLPKVQDKTGVRMVFGGEEQATNESMQSFAVALIYSMLAIYFILVVLFDSFFQPLIVVAIVPFGLAGVIMTFFSMGMPISFLGIIGTLGLVGVMVNDSLVMVSHLNDLRQQHRGLSLDMMVEGCKSRLRPVLLTTITTVLGLIPTILGLGGYEPFIIPLVLALAGGLIFATPITLILVPTLYSFVARKMPQ